MTLEETRAMWNAQVPPPEARSSDERVLEQVLARSRELDRVIRWRDAREGIAAVVVALFMAPLLTKGTWLSRAGVLVILAGAAVILTVLLRSQRGARPDAGWPLAEVLRAERARVDQQIRLLGSILWWYIAPLTAGLTLLTLGLGGVTWFTTAYLAIVALTQWGIYALNQRAVRNDLRPRRMELDRLLSELES
jgi:hypothetical protein